MQRDFTVYEVGPRDGLQALPHTVPIEDRLRLIRLLQAAGVRSIEAGAFVNPKRVPQMAGAGNLFRQLLPTVPGTTLSALVPNARGMRDAHAAGVEHFNIFFSPNDDFNRANLDCSRGEAVAQYANMLLGIPKDRVRVYISMAFSSELDEVEDAIAAAELLGDTVVLSDTNGCANPDSIRQVIGLSPGPTALHLHAGTEGVERMLRNVEVAFDAGIREFDTSIGGLGGCPFVPGSRGNLPTEALVAWSAREGLDCGINLPDLDAPLVFAQQLSVEGVTA